jgi:hypothetical protein
VEKVCSDDILSPIYDNSYDACAPNPFKIPIKIVERATSYKHVNFCGVHRPCEQSYDKEDYYIHHRNEETRMWYKALDELG